MNCPEKIDILIVDDRPENLLVLEKILENPGVNILKANSGNEALGLLLEYDFALVLLDVQMPFMDGFETAELMRGNNKTRHIPIIFITAISKDPIHVFKGYETGAVDYLFKPLDSDILRKKVDVFLALHRHRIQLQKMNKELREVNRKLINHQQKLIEEERLKVLLQLAGASVMELNQPLSSLSGNIDLLQWSPHLPTDTIQLLTRIKEAGQQISDVIKKINVLPRFPFEEEKWKNTVINDGKWTSLISNLPGPLKILSIENSDCDFEFLKNVLNDEKRIDLFRARNLKEAKIKLEQENIDLAFSDLFLEDGTGYDLLIHIEKNRLEVPCIVITGQGDEVLASKIIQAGAYDYIPKNKLLETSLPQVINNTLQKFYIHKDVKKLQAKMAEMSTIDELTGLPNRRYFNEALEKEFERTRRYNNAMVLIMIDLDSFKKINDTYGHPCGDIVLTETAKILKKEKRLNDLVCRYGGEEFAVILPNTDMEGAYVYCEKIRETVAKQIFICDQERFHITLSAGCTSSLEASSHEELILHADQALFQAKSMGRNCIASYKNLSKESNKPV